MPCSLLCDSCSGARIWCQHDSCSQTSQNMMTFGLFSNYIMAGHIVESILTVHPEETWENYRKLGKHFHEQLTESSSPDNFSGAGRWRSKNNLCRQFQLSLANLSPRRRVKFVLTSGRWASLGMVGHIAKTLEGSGQENVQRGNYSTYKLQSNTIAKTSLFVLKQRCKSWPDKDDGKTSVDVKGCATVSMGVPSWFFLLCSVCYRQKRVPQKKCLRPQFSEFRWHRWKKSATNRPTPLGKRKTGLTPEQATQRNRR